ncbi:MAG: hypothetical protein ACRELB_22135 [Polyangiaceae bacterium]
MSKTYGGSNAAAAVQDMKPTVNSHPFGLCQSPLNPHVAAATAAAAGTLTPLLCLRRDDGGAVDAGVDERRATAPAMLPTPASASASGPGRFRCRIRTDGDRGGLSMVLAHYRAVFPLRPRDVLRFVWFPLLAVVILAVIVLVALSRVGR